MTLHCMIDLETMGNGVDAAITATGAVKFDPTDPIPLPPPTGDLKPHEFYMVVDLASSVKYGLKMDASTVLWWLGQDEPSRQALIAPGPTVQVVTCGEMLHLLAGWYNANEGHPEVMWSHATFDATILNHAYRLKDKNPPWGYRDVLDLRTLTRLFQTEQMAYPTDNKHHALWDAWRQANLLKAIYARVKDALPHG